MSADRRGLVRVASLVLAGAFAVAACSGSESSLDTEPVTATEPVEAPPSDASSTTTSTSTTTTEPEVTTVPATVRLDEPEPTDAPVPTNAPDTSTTEAPRITTPVNTVFAPDTVEGAIEFSILNDNEAIKRCFAALPNCDPDDLTLFAVLDYEEGQREFADAMNTDGWTAARVDTLRVTMERIVEFSDDGTEAIVEVCADFGVQFFLDGALASEDTGGAFSARRRMGLIRVGELWTIFARETIERVDGEDTGLCN